jgi:vacuolar-type H+-ATPase subunit E/Vma4
MTQTTLILGAGASASYGFPTGFELTQKILKLEDNKELLIYFSNENSGLVRQFFQSFRMSTATSIDSFVAKNFQYMAVARTAIAMVLIEMEDRDVFFNHTINDHWYRYLVNRICPDGWDAFDPSRVRVVTFSYDVSLEFFLVNAVAHMYGKRQAEVVEKLKKMEIIHVYGKLERPFDTYGQIKTNIDLEADNVDLTKQDVLNASENIQLMAQGREDNKHLQVIQNIIHSSDQIGILGFGFDAVNVERIFGGIPFSTPEC